jgi:hypothetical protein
VLADVLWDDFQCPGQVCHVVDVTIGVHVAATAQLTGGSQLQAGRGQTATITNNDPDGTSTTGNCRACGQQLIAAWRLERATATAS